MPQEDIRNEILIKLSDLVGAEVTFHPVQEDEGRVIPAFNVDAIVSKTIAFLVFCGINIPPASMLPPYNRVHADVEWWKKRIAEMEQKTDGSAKPEQSN